MITGYEFKNINNEKFLILYLNYDSEFGIDFKYNHKNNSMKNQIKKFIKEKNIKLNGEKIALSFGGIILAVLLMMENPTVTEDFKLTYVSNSITPNEIVEVIETSTPSNESLKNSISITVENNEIGAYNKQETFTNNLDTNISNNNISNIKESVNNNLNNSQNNIDNKDKNESLPITDNSPNDILKEEKNELPKVTVYRTNGSIITLSLEEYLIGVVGAEMPASFNIEALKAQAVVARTYALKKIKSQEKLTDTVTTQSYKDNDELKKEWKESYDTYYQKVKTAVESTKNLAIYYNNKLIDAVYHSTSNGKTEDSIYVWGNDIPYLKSVDSSWDKDATTYFKETSKDFNNVLNLLGIELKEDITFEILSRDESNRVLEIKIGNKIFSGVEFRNLLGLRSTDFDLSINNETINIKTKGYGHGVGMSQYGANGMAKQGYNYQDILKHYYTGVTIQ